MSLCKTYLTFILLLNHDMMKKIPLLPSSFLWIGIALSLLSALIFVYNTVIQIDDLYIRTFVLINDFPFKEKEVFKLSEVEIYITVQLLSLLIGLSFIAFAKTKIEDEMITYLRLYCWTWSFIIVLIISVLAILFIYGLPFVYTFTLLIHALLIIYIVLFYTNLFSLNRRGAHEKLYQN